MVGSPTTCKRDAGGVTYSSLSPMVDGADSKAGEGELD